MQQTQTQLKGWQQDRLQYLPKSQMLLLPKLGRKVPDCHPTEREKEEWKNGVGYNTSHLNLFYCSSQNCGRWYWKCIIVFGNTYISHNRTHANWERKYLFKYVCDFFVLKELCRCYFGVYIFLCNSLHNGFCQNEGTYIIEKILNSNNNISKSTISSYLPSSKDVFLTMS